MTVKLVVIYPRPANVEAFETVYKRDHVPMAVEKLGGKTKIVASKIVGSPQGTPPFPSHCRDPFPLHGGSASLRRIGRWQTDARECSGNFFRRRTDLPGRRRGSIRVSREVTYRPRVESVRITDRW